MKKLILIAFLAMLTACEAVKDEVGYLGGYPERVANKHIFEARSQRQRADRYFMSLVILAPLAADLIQSDAEASAAATLINKAYKNLYLMYESAEECLSINGAPTCNASADKTVVNTAFVFETHAYEMQRTLYALSKQTLGAADLDEIVDDVISLNVLAVYKALKKAFPVARRMLATYRDTVITFGDAIAISCLPKTKDPSKTCRRLHGQIARLRNGTTADNLALELSNDRLVSAMLATLKAASTERGAGHEWQLQQQHILGLTYHIDRACKNLATEQLSDDILGADSDRNDIAKIVNCGKAIELGELAIAASLGRDKFKTIATATKP